MSPSTLLQSLFSSLLDSPAVVEIASQAGKNAFSLIQKHFTYSAYEISKAYQESYGYALGAIRVGVAAPDKTLAFTDKIFQSKITREFAAKIEKHYFQPFVEKSDGEALSSFRKQLIDNIKVLSKRTDKFQFEQVTEEDLFALINYQETIAITDLVIEQIAPLDDIVADFFRYEGLLGNALLFFFRECLRRDERLKTTQALLQREGLCVTVQDIQSELTAIEGRIIEAVKNKSPILELAQRQNQLIEVETAWQTRHAQLIQFNQRFENQLGELLSWAENIYVALENLQEQVEETNENVKETKNLVEEILDKVTALLARQNVSAQIKPRDEFTHHNSRSLELIQEVFSQLKQVSSKTPQYYRASILVGSALSSSGDLERASRLFQQTIENSQNSAEMALAHFNLFQVQLRNKAYGDALKNLEAAIKIDSQQYALHDTHKYPMKRILGAGGMGCVFLCGVRLKKNKRVAVKCFWENRKGSRDEIFHEPLLMAEIAGEWVPEPLDYGYFDNAQQARAFFVTEYIDDAVDGEAWLEKNGHLNVKTALPVALQIAQGLQIAHQAGIFHLDLKPANLLLIQTKKGFAVKIIDFGLSQVANSLRDEVAGQKTRTGLTTFGQAIFGTLDYAPPEQQGYIQFGQPSAKSDIFAFGKTLYRLLTGEMPLEVEPETLEDSPNWYKLLYSCTRTNPAKRPQSVGELISLLKAIEAVSETKKKEAAERAKRQAEAERLEKRRQLEKEQAERAKRQQAEAEQLEKRRQLEKARQARYGKRFQFEIVTVNRKGEIIHRKQKQARCQTEDLGNGVTLEMVYIPGGTFTMGSPKTEKRRDSDESPQHQVTVQPFFMAKYPVTQSQWQAVMGDNPSSFKGKKRPVENVSWDDVVKFCQRLSEKTGKAYRLPSEAEWEYACRAGTTTPFYFGETITTDLANYDGNYTYASEPKGVRRGETTDVGNFPPNVFGLYDMHGNVWEWCADNWHDNYEGAPSDGSIWEKGNSGQPVIRGGSWNIGPRFVRAANRGWNSHDYRFFNVGFRLAR